MTYRLILFCLAFLLAFHSREQSGDGIVVAAPLLITQLPCVGDLDQNGVIDSADLQRLGVAWRDPARFDPALDFVADGRIDILDLTELSRRWNTPCPTATPTTEPSATASATTEPSPSPTKTATATPTETATPTVTPTPTATPTATPTPFVLRINVGGGSYTDGSGLRWQADQAYTSATGWGYVDEGNSNTAATTSGIGGTPDQPLFRSQRVGPTGRTSLHTAFAYQIDNVPAGDYRLELLFAEFDPAVSLGQRKLNLSIATEWVAHRFDIMEQSNSSPLSAVRVPMILRHCGGPLLLTVQGGQDGSRLPAVLNGLSLHGVPPQSEAATLPIRINAGASEPYTDHTGHTWWPDINRCGGSHGYHLGVAKAKTLEISGTNDDPLYNSERTGDPDPVGVNYDDYFDYHFPTLPPGLYQLTFKQAEFHYYPGSGSVRAFSILVNDQVVVDRLNILAVTGRTTALDLVRCVQLTTPGLRLHFRQEAWQQPDGTWRRQGHPKIGAFEIAPATSCTPSGP